jgi:molybdopterin-guanine dinucleotide biosynthesis protein A
MLTNEITGAVLAGGKSERMGSNKALLKLDNKTIIASVTDVLKACFPEIIIISDQQEGYTSLGCPIFYDILKNAGPLGGIHSALTNSKTETVFISSCDIPKINPNIIKYLLDSHTKELILIVRYKNQIQPLFGVYSKKLLDKLNIYIKSGDRKVSEFIKILGTEVTVVDAPTQWEQSGFLDNINTPDDYQLLTSRERSK